MRDTDWLENLKQGDEVAIANGGGWSKHYRFAPVTRLTATQIIVGTSRYRRRDGYEVGQTYRRDYLVQATAELKAELAQERRRNEMLVRLRDARWRDLPDEALERVVAVLDSVKVGDAESVEFRQLAESNGERL